MSAPSDHGTLCLALHRDHRPLEAVRDFVLRRHRDGWTLEEVLADLDRIRRHAPDALRRSIDWLEIWTTASVAYNVTSEGALVAAGSRDALSGLPNASYLIVLLEDLVDGDDDTDHVLVHLRAAPTPRGLDERLPVAVAVATALRRSVPAPVTVAMVAATHAVALVPPLLDAEAVLAGARRRATTLAPRAEIDGWTAPRPQTPDELHRTVATFC